MFRRSWTPLLVAVLSTLVATAFRVAYLPQLELRAPFLTFYPAVLLAAVLAGYRCSLLATLLAAGVSLVLHAWAPVSGQNPYYGVKIFTFILTGALVSFMTWARDRATIRAVEAEAQVRIAAERERARDQVRDMEELNRATLQSLPLHIAVLDRDGRITGINQAWSDFADRNGGRSGVAVGANYLEACRRAVADQDPDAAQALAGIEKVLRGELGQFTLEYPCHGPDQQRWFLMTVVPLQAPRAGGTVVTHLNITERKALQDALLAQQDELTRTNELLEQRVLQRTADLELAIREQEAFSYSVSHDLRAPLRHINSFSRMLAEDFGETLPREAQVYLERVLAASGKMGALIDHLLELSRVTRTELAVEKVDLSALVRTCLERLRQIEPDRVVQQVVLEEVVVLGDPYLLEQLLENLLGNAWKYTSRKAEARIEFGRTVVQGEEAFFVRDNGAGFDMQYQQNLFKAFERLHGAEFEGIGIGLATAQRIVQRHGGRIWAEGAVGQGATFYFTLPVYF